MKKDKSKSKSHETNIGKIIYGFLLFMPLIAVTSAILINTFNMQTKEKAEIHYRYQTNEVNSNYDIINGNIYLINLTQFDNNIGLNELIEIDSDTDIFLKWINKPNYKLSFDAYDNEIDDAAMPLYETSLYLNYEVNDNIIYYGWLDNLIKATFTDINLYYSVNRIQNYNVPFVIKITDINHINNEFYKYIKPVTDLSLIPIDYVETHNINAEEVFYNSINKVEESNLFNWTQNSIIYTTLTATCTTLSINNTFIPLLLAYWLIISVIYILYDIALIMLMIFHRKVHELQECI